MNVLFGVDSVFQLMIAINMRLTIFESYRSDIIIYNSTRNAEEYCKKLAETEVFNNCFLAVTPLTYCGDNYRIKDKIKKYPVYLSSLYNPLKCIRKILDGFSANYDVFLFNGEGALPECIFNACKTINSNIVCYRFEDSYLSYTFEYGSKKGYFRNMIESMANIFFSRHNINDSIKGYYFAKPDLVQYNFNYSILQAPLFSRDNDYLRTILNYIFSFDELKDDYHEKYIFFECGDAFFFNNNEDLNYVRKLIEIVGGDNVLIKRHPRIKENRYANMSVHVAQGSTVPWELIQLNITLHDKVFITTKSSAALTSEVYFGDRCSAMFLYKGIKGNQGEIGENFVKYVKKFKEVSKNKFWLPNSINEFEKIIREETLK